VLDQVRIATEARFTELGLSEDRLDVGVLFAELSNNTLEWVAEDGTITVGQVCVCSVCV
jgi:hypothetical protein